MTRRRPMTAARRLRILDANDCTCHICGQLIDAVKPWEVLALGPGGDDTNCRPAHYRCHKMKTKNDRQPDGRRG